MVTDVAPGYEQLHVEVSGPPDGPPILLLHGWGSHARMMQPIAERLADRYRLYNLDLPGHGYSPPPPVAWGVPQHAALLHRFITGRVLPETSTRAVTIIGHSNGGRIALYMASEPDMAPLLRRLVLVSPSGVRPLRSWRYRLRAGLATALKAPFEHLPEPLRRHGLDWLRHSLLWRALGSADYRALDGVMRATFVKTVNCYLEDRLDRIEVPTLLFRGDRDADVSARQMAVLEKKLPDAGLVTLKNAGHYGYLDDPDTFVAATRHFLEVTDAPPQPKRV